MRILIVATNAKMLANFRGDLIREMIVRGHDILAACPDDEAGLPFCELGIRYLRVFFSGTGTNPFADLKLTWELRNLMLDEQPDLVFSYAMKPVIYSSIAARMAGIRSVYSMITGLGYVFVGTGAKGLCLRLLARLLYRFALKGNRKVIFQNPDDQRDFLRWRLVDGMKCVVVNGSGVNIERFSPVPLPREDTFIMVGRLIRDKGVVEYLEAARRVKRAYPMTRFLLVGPFDPNPSSIGPGELLTCVEGGFVEYLGEVDDVRPALAASSVFVLPSYREGTPRSTLEAMAMGRPIITTDAPGCRETVVDGVNGLLVPVRDIDRLSAAMIWMLEHRDQIERMGQESIRLCTERFDVRKVNHVMLDAMGLLDAPNETMESSYL